MNTLKKIVIILMILHALDLLSTYIWVNRFGIRGELNPLARLFLYQLGIVPGLLTKLVIVDIPLVASIYWFTKKWKDTKGVANPILKMIFAKVNPLAIVLLGQIIVLINNTRLLLKYGAN